MNILSVELTHSEAKSIIAQFIDQIEILKVCKLDTLEKGTEIEVETEYLDFYATIRFDSEYNEVEQPDCPTLVDRSVHCKIQAINKQGSEVQFKVEPERYYCPFLKKFATSPAIDIAEQIEKQFTV